MDSGPRATPAAGEAHAHKWRGVAHIDGCHFYAWSYVCECGATAETYSERDVKGDPYSMVWMERDEGDEPCARCEELLNGAKPKHEKHIEEAKSSAA